MCACFSLDMLTCSSSKYCLIQFHAAVSAIYMERLSPSITQRLQNIVYKGLYGIPYLHARNHVLELEFRLVCHLELLVAEIF